MFGEHFWKNGSFTDEDGVSFCRLALIGQWSIAQRNAAFWKNAPPTSYTNINTVIFLLDSKAAVALLLSLGRTCTQTHAHKNIGKFTHTYTHCILTLCLPSVLTQTVLFLYPSLFSSSFILLLNLPFWIWQLNSQWNVKNINFSNNLEKVLNETVQHGMEIYYHYCNILYQINRLMKVYTVTALIQQE